MKRRDPPLFRISLTKFERCTSGGYKPNRISEPKPSPLKVYLDDEDSTGRFKILKGIDMHFEEPQKPKKTPIRILEAADKLFSQIGFDGVSVNDVAVEARVNKASVFYHFGNKEALFEQVLSNYHTAHQNALEQAFSDGGTKRERLHKVIDAYINFISENRRYPTLVQGLLTASNDRSAFVKRGLAPLQTWIEEALSDDIPNMGPTSARHFFITVTGAVMNYFTYGPALSDAWAEDMLGESGIQERREHLHWLVDTLLDNLEIVPAGEKPN